MSGDAPASEQPLAGDKAEAIARDMGIWSGSPMSDTDAAEFRGRFGGARHDTRPSEFAGTCVITWPRPRGKAAMMAGWGVSLTDAVTGEPINTVSALLVHLHASASDLVWADLEMFADADGKPLYSGTPVMLDVVFAEGGRGRVPRKGTFPFLVSEMRVAEADSG